jgi:predicted RND superfamily exporter protein
MNLSALSGVAITLVVAGIVIALGLNIMSETGDEFDANSYEANATDDAIEGVAKLSAKLPLIGLVVAAVIVIGLIVGAFATRR